MPLLRTVGRTAVIAGTASAVNGRVSRRQQRRWSEQEAKDAAYQQQQQQAAQQQAAAQAPPPAEGSSMDDKVKALQQLAELKEQGILTEEEFAAQKAQILAS